MKLASYGATASRRISVFGFLLLAVATFSPSISPAQVSTGISSISPAEAQSGMPLTLRAELQRGELFERVHFVYRTFGESEWTPVEMQLRGNTAIVVLPAEAVQPIYLDYYIVLTYRSGTLEAYPLNDSPDPFVRTPSKTLQLPVRQKEEDIQVAFLSPEQNSIFESRDVLISVSLLRVDSSVVRRATQIILDGADVSKYAVLSDDILVYVPDNHGLRLKPGRHKVSVVLYTREGKLYRQVSTFFNVVGDGKAEEVTAETFVPNGTIDLEMRSERVNNVSTWYKRGGMRFTGSQGDWRINSNLFLTSDEQPDRQPQNRYYVALESQWLAVGYGDSYPMFPNLILNGKRVRGLNSSVHLGLFNVDMALGTTVRDIEGALLKVIPLSDLGTEQAADPNAAYARIDSLTWGKYSYGTYARDLFAIRPSFGSGEQFQIGLTWLKAKDDPGSIRFGTRPQENLVVGLDAISKFDKNRIEFAGQAAFSAYNSDISSGNFTDAYIDSVYKKDASTIKDARDILKHFITVNDNLRPLSFKKMSTLAYDLSVTLNYFDNTFKASYISRGSDYNSFGQTFLRNDVAGINLLDRWRLVANNLFITLGYERLRDNTSDSKVATTWFTTLNTAVNYDPGPDLPSFSAGWTRYVNANNASGSNSNSAVDDQTNRFFFLVSHRFSLGAAHTASASISTSHRNDYTLRNFDVKNISASFNLSTKYIVPLQTSVGFTTNYNSFPSPFAPTTTTEIKYSSLFMFAQYSFFEEEFIVGTTYSPMFGDFKRMALDFNVQWNATQNWNLMFQYSYFANDGAPNDNFGSLKIRYDI